MDSFGPENIRNRIVRIGDVFIPATNILITETSVGFDVEWECEDCIWTVQSIPRGVEVVVFGPVGCIMDMMNFPTWDLFADHFRKIQLGGTMGGIFINDILANPVLNVN
jgi:hypothetical protein